MSNVLDYSIWRREELYKLTDALCNANCNDTYGTVSCISVDYLIHLHITTSPTRAPAGPAILIADPPLLNTPAPITEVITMNCDKMLISFR